MDDLRHRIAGLSPEERVLTEHLVMKRAKAAMKKHAIHRRGTSEPCVLSRLRTAFQVQIPLRSLFEYPTIAGLAIQIIQSQDEITDLDELALLLAELEGSAPGSVSRFKEIEDERDE